jgi:hypothetical protein
MNMARHGRAGAKGASRNPRAEPSITRHKINLRYLMTKKIAPVLAALIIALGTLFALNPAVPQAQAQVPGLTIPVLTETDFQNFLEIYPLAQKDPTAYTQAIIDRKLDPVQFTGVIAKITSNVFALQSPEALTALKTQYGDAIELNSDEQPLFDKYKDQLVPLVTQGAVQ